MVRFKKTKSNKTTNGRKFVILHGIGTVHLHLYTIWKIEGDKGMMRRRPCPSVYIGVRDIA